LPICSATIVNNAIEVASAAWALRWIKQHSLHRKAKAEPDTKKRAPSVPLADAPDANKLWAHLRRRRTARYVIEFNGAPIRSVWNGFEAMCQRAGLNYNGQPKVAAVLADLETAPISEPLRALRMLGKLTCEQTVGADDMRSLLAAGVLPSRSRMRWRFASPSI
jgi:hypothetical protein